MASLVLGQDAVTNVNGRIEGFVKRSDTGDSIPACAVVVGSGSAAGVTTRTGLTDSAGHFVIQDVPPGEYAPLACANNIDGYVQPGLRSIAVGSGEQVRGLMVELVPRDGVISGRIVDSRGNPLSGIQVHTVKKTYENGKMSVVEAGNATTNDRGEYRIFSLDSGTYYVRTNIRNRPGGINVDTFFPGVLDPENAVQVLVKSGAETAKIDFTNQTVPMSTISGKVILPHALKQLENPHLTLYLLRRDKVRLGSEPSYTIAMDDATGSFTIGATLSRGVGRIIPGSYYLLAWLRDVPTFVAATTSFGLVVEGIRPSDPTFAYVGKVPVEVLPGQNVEGLIINLDPASTVEGKVVLAADDKTTNVESLRLSLDPLYLEPATLIPAALTGLALQPTRPARNGTFTFPRLPEGNYGIRVEGLPEGAYVADMIQGDTSVYDHGLVLSADSAKPVELLIKPKGGTARGTVLNAEERGVPYAMVVLVPGISRRSNTAFYKTVRTDGAGAFTFRGVVPGEYKVFAWESIPHGAYHSPDFIASFEDRGAPVKAQPGETVDNVSVRLIQGEP